MGIYLDTQPWAFTDFCSFCLQEAHPLDKLDPGNTPNDEVKTWITKAIGIPTLHYTAVLQKPGLNTLAARNQNKQRSSNFVTQILFSLSQAAWTCSEHQRGNKNIQSDQEGKPFFKLPLLSREHHGWLQTHLLIALCVHGWTTTTLIDLLPISPYKCWHSTSSISISYGWHF